MPRRADPRRIYEAGRAAIRNRLLSDGMDAEATEWWLTAWELEAAVRELPGDRDYWTGRRRLDRGAAGDATTAWRVLSGSGRRPPGKSAGGTVTPDETPSQLR